MRIALDATPLAGPVGGIRRYTVELSLGLAREYPEDEFTLISDQPFILPGGAPNLKAGRGPRNGLESKWWTIGLAREQSRLRTDVFHGTDFAVPYFPLRPSVMTVHDLSPWVGPGKEDASARVRRRTPILAGLGLATIIITPTASVRRQVLDHFRVSPHRVAVTPLAASSRFRPNGARRGRFFLLPGTRQARKNIALLLQSWRELRKFEEVDLVLAGRSREIDRKHEIPGLHILGEVSEERLVSLYSETLAVLYPSAYEGFGLPVLEAMQCGAVVITSKDPAIGEVAGDAAVRIDAGDVRGWVEAMRKATTDADWASGLRERALLRARDFSWQRTARATREIYHEARCRFA